MGAFPALGCNAQFLSHRTQRGVPLLNALVNGPVRYPFAHANIHDVALLSIRVIVKNDYKHIVNDNQYQL